MNKYRTKNCGELRKEDIGSEVKLAGWIGKNRNLGAMAFIDLRDEFGITQIVMENRPEFEAIKPDLNTESCIIDRKSVV